MKNILLRDVKKNALFGQIPEIKKDRHKPVTKETVKERIVIVANASGNDQMQKAYLRICLYVPNTTIEESDSTKYEEPNNKRLDELENEALNVFRSYTYGEFGKERYLYKVEEIVQEEDPETWSSFLNVKIKFEVVNTKL